MKAALSNVNEKTGLVEKLKKKVIRKQPKQDEMFSKN